ncbi:hypothetical protein TNCT_206071 [Trichonephila clavata]|uniref:Uncharacterized protein n=1 Tax=Trichonephila clavata TaxID=2740835 RepID=A0A8X6G334_TRICU|nr:hypothetical protein TNCT_206071 [Trichonephila clavata]
MPKEIIMEFDIYTILNEARSLYRATKLKEREADDNIFKNWGFPTEKDDSLDFKKNPDKEPPLHVVSSPPRNKKLINQPAKTNTPLLVSRTPPPRKMLNNLAPTTPTWSKLVTPPRASTPKQYIKPPPPITIDNVDRSGQLLKSSKN